ncbi:MAG: hypothetical protein NVV82_02600 [Sporocytophaga sp.]|nr:hypothetical protein [Sporocytophaga sp.]
MKSGRFLFIILLFLFSCNLKQDHELEPDWNAQILGPLVKEDLSINEVPDIDSFAYVNAFSLEKDFGITQEMPIKNVPEIGPLSLPINHLDLTETFKSAEVESGEIYFVLTNNLPFDVKQGVIVKISQSGDPLGAPLVNDTLPLGLPGNGGVYKMPPLNLNNKTLLPEMDLQIINFATKKRTDTDDLLDPSKEFKIEVYIDKLKFKSITLSQGNTFNVEETVDLNLKGTDINAKSLSGKLYTFANNGMPLKFSLQLYFLDGSYTVLDSLFNTDPTIQEPVIANGVTVTPRETKITTELNETKANKIINAEFLRIKFNAANPPDVTINKDNLLKFQLTGDLDVAIKK